MPTDRYAEIAFSVPSERAEELSATLVELGAAGVEERNQATLAKGPDATTATLLVWLPVEVAHAFLTAAAAAGLPPPAEAGRVRHEDEWRDVWKQYFRPRQVGRFVIVPSWERFQPTADEVVLDLDPGRAFGTGGHASTRLCLLAISELARCERLLDVGCGSGILAIAAARRFPAARGQGLDVDGEAVAVAQENAARNGVAARLTFATTPVEAITAVFDLVLANILPDVLIPLAAPIAARVARGGRLVLSGIVPSAAAEVVAAYRARGLSLVAEREEEGFCALTLSPSVEA